MRDLNGEAYADAKAYFYEADTSTPLIVYQDYGLGTAHSNPVRANAYGIFPPVFFDEADGFFRQRITTSAGVLIPDTDMGTLPIIGPSGGGGGSEVPVDENALARTGDVKARYDTGTLSGWVRMNGRTIGSSVSGAAERANSDCENLFLHLWSKNSTLSVSGGRGASGAADWAANKTIALPDAKGCVLVGLDDMGSTAAGRLTSTYFGTDPTVLGANGGAQSVTLDEAMIPSHEHDVYIKDPSHHHTFVGTAVPNGGFITGADTGARYSGTPSTSTASTGITIGSINGVADDNKTASVGGGDAHSSIQPSLAITLYIKL